MKSFPKKTKSLTYSLSYSPIRDLKKNRERERGGGKKSVLQDATNCYSGMVSASFSPLAKKDLTRT